MAWRKSKFCLLVLCLFIFNFGSAQEKQFNEETWKELTEELDYGDIKDTPKEEAREYSPQSTSGSGGGFALGKTGQIIVLSLIVLFLIFLVARLLGFGTRGKKVLLKREHQFSIDTLEEYLHESNLERFLRIALKNQNYRVAIRIYYLMVIKNLSELGWIVWKKNKTNYDYVREMRGQSSHKKFRSLTGAFEIIWYGDATIHESEYKQLHAMFKDYITYLELNSKEK